MLEKGSEHGWPTLPQVHSRESSLGVTEGGSPALPKEARKAPVRGKASNSGRCYGAIYTPAAKEEPLLLGHLPVCLRTKGRLISSGM